MLDLARNLPFPLGANYPEFPDGCLATELPLVEDVHEVLVDGPHVLLEQIGDQRLRQPDGLALEAALDARPAVFGLLENELGFTPDAVLRELGEVGRVARDLPERLAIELLALKSTVDDAVRHCSRNLSAGQGRVKR
mgnify:CR=1 FL=1